MIEALFRFIRPVGYNFGKGETGLIIAGDLIGGVSELLVHPFCSTFSTINLLLGFCIGDIA